jgi:hypothetical protein
MVKIKRKRSLLQSEAFCGFAAHSRGFICRIRSTSTAPANIDSATV